MMALINYVKTEEATGFIAEIYKNIEERMRVVPNVIKFHTASPDLFLKIMSVFNHFSDHATIDPVTIAYTRLLISNISGGEYCFRFQSSILKYLGIPEEDLVIAKKDYYQTKLDEKRKALVCFVLDEMFDKIKNAKVRIDELKVLGWTEKDIYEASIIGALQKGMVQVIKTFNVKFDF